MTRVEFLEQLEYLLQDIDDRDRADALDYYRDYMDEAGVRENDTVEQLLESPEKIAVSLRISLTGNEEEQLESGEQGFKNSHAEAAAKVPDIYGRQEESKSERCDDAYEAAFDYDYAQEVVSSETKEKKSHLGKILLIVFLCLVGSPIIFGIGGSIIGLVFGILCGILGLVLGVAGGAIGFLIGGIIVFVMSIVQMMTAIPQGVFMMGISLLMVAVGILLAMLTITLFKRFIPWLIQTVVKLFRRIFHRDGGEKA